MLLGELKVHSGPRQTRVPRTRLPCGRDALGRFGFGIVSQLERAEVRCDARARAEFAGAPPVACSGDMCTRDMNHSGRNAPIGNSASLGAPSRARISAKCPSYPVSAAKQMDPDGV